MSDNERFYSHEADTFMKAGTVDLDNVSVDVTVTNGNTGGGQPHNNMQPYLVVNYIIALQGVYPSRG